MHGQAMCTMQTLSQSGWDEAVLETYSSASLCIGMARKQNGSYNASISVQTLIFHLVVNSMHLKTVISVLWHCPNSIVALRLLKDIVNSLNAVNLYVAPPTSRDGCY